MFRMNRGFGIGRTCAGAMLAATVLLVGCASEPREPASPKSGPIEAEAISDAYQCGHHELPASAIEHPKRIADQDAATRAAIAGATDDLGRSVAPVDPESWIVLSQNAEQISLIRRNSALLEGGVQLAGSALGEPDYEELTLMHVASEGGWKFASNDACRLSFDLGELQVPELALDPASASAPDSRELHLLVLDSTCGGDTDMPGRISVVRLDETDDEVRVVLGVRPLPPGAYNCPGFPPTPYAVELEEPLGNRSVIDASRVTPYELPLVSAQSQS